MGQTLWVLDENKTEDNYVDPEVALLTFETICFEIESKPDSKIERKNDLLDEIKDCKRKWNKKLTR